MFFKNIDKDKEKQIQDKYGLANLYLITSISKHYEKIIDKKLQGVVGQIILFPKNDDELISQIENDKGNVYILYEKFENKVTYVHGTAIPYGEQLKGYDDDGEPIYNDKNKCASTEIKKRQQIKHVPLFEQVAQYELGKFFNLSHAIAIKIDNKKKVIYYVDSYGHPISEGLENKLKKKFPRYLINCNTIQYQHGEDHSNCFIFATENMERLSHEKIELFDPMKTGYIEPIEEIRKKYANLIEKELEFDLKELTEQFAIKPSLP